MIVRESRSGGMFPQGTFDCMLASETASTNSSEHRFSSAVKLYLCFIAKQCSQVGVQTQFHK